MLFRSDRKSTRLNSSHTIISYAVFCLKKKKKEQVGHQTPAEGCLVSCPAHVQQAGHTVPTGASRRRAPTRPASRATLFLFFLKDRRPPGTYPLPLHGAFPI